MTNPYVSPSDIRREDGETSDVSAAPKAGIFAALFVGFACYIPSTGIRGALFCLYPGVAQRSLRISVIGATLGYLVDCAFLIIWRRVAGVWEPRDGYNAILVHNLPPSFFAATHVGSPMPNSMKFGLGLALWVAVMCVAWIALMKPQLRLRQGAFVTVMAFILTSLIAVLLWTVAPLGGYHGYGAKPFADLPPAAFLVVFAPTMPAIAFAMAALINRYAKPAEPEPGAQRTAELELPDKRNTPGSKRVPFASEGAEKDLYSANPGCLIA